VTAAVSLGIRPAGRWASAEMLGKLLLRAITASWRNGQFGAAKAAAFSGLVAFFPLLATIAAVLVRMRAGFLSRVMVDLLEEVLPPGAAELAFQHLAWEGSQPVLLPVTAVVLSVWAAAGVVTSLMQGFRATYGITGSRPPWPGAGRFGAAAAGGAGGTLGG